MNLIDTTIVEAFQRQVKKSPDHIAIAFRNRSLTYRELDEKTNQIASFLSTKGVKAETMVPICFYRSLNMVIAIWSILKAGGAYVPIDPDHPSERINYILSDTDAAFFLTDSASSHNYNNPSACIEKINFDNIEEVLATQGSMAMPQQPQPHHLAYVIYTSGSTGRPKGVMIEHASLLNRMAWAQSYYQLSEEDVVLQKTTYSFDVSVWELTWPFIAGSKLLMAEPDGHKNNSYLINTINEQKVSIIHFVPSMLELFLDEIEEGDCKSLTKVLCSGEALKFNHVVNFRAKLPHAELHNLYGPTEAAVDVTYWDVHKEFNPDSSVIPIGKPVSNTSIYIVNDKNELAGEGEIGEIHIGGVQVARGYLKNPQLTSEKFITDIFDTTTNGKLYKTGDLGRWLPDGNIEYLGRTDHQVKIRGFRIELGEIENRLLDIEGIKQAVVIAREDDRKGSYLAAYIVKENANTELHKQDIYKTLERHLPEYMIPRFYVEMESLPLTSSGKTDRKLLPEPNETALQRGLYVAPKTALEKQLAHIWQHVLHLQKVGTADNFFELGGTSLIAQKTIAAIKNELQLTVPITKIYQHPTISALASFLGGRTKSKRARPAKNTNANTDIAIIGMECNFPGATTIDGLWDILKDGKETITWFKAEDIDTTIADEIKNDPTYVRARGIIKDTDSFDAAFFGIHPKLAELMDPQHRVFLELCRNLLEKTGYLPEKNNSTIGVFAGCNTNTYFNNNLIWHKDKLDLQGLFPVASVTDKDYISSRVSYQLNLEGPAVNVNSACSTGLLAVAQAVESIRSSQCNVAIAGAASVNIPVHSGHLYSDGAMMSADGHTKTFDANAKGTVFSDGAGAVLLKALQEAEADGDTIYAVIKGVGVNNDGGHKGSFSAPSAEGQYGAISMAISDAGVNPADISYVEAHGTATPLGDPIEIEGLKMAFGEQEQKQFCAIGSIKSNIGHLTHPAGIAGLIKTTLSLYHRQLPPSLHFTKPNPAIDFENSPFFVNTHLNNWQVNGKKRVAGVSSFGVGGTNVHVVVQEYSSENKTNNDHSSGRPSLISWSAHNVESLNAYAKKLADFLHNTPSVDITDVAYTLHTTRQELAVRNTIVAHSTQDLLHQLQDENKTSSTIHTVTEKDKGVVFMFPGQGSQYINMGRELYHTEPVFKKAVDECASILKTEMGEDIRSIIFADMPDEKRATEKLKNTYYTQPSIFTISYGIATLYMSWGIQPAALVGHSVGEFVAAHLSGVLTLKEALHIVANRARLISLLPGGSMLSVRASASNIRDFLPGTISIAAINAPQLCVLAGATAEIEAFSAVLNEKGIANKLLRTSHAFHSAMMDAIVAPLQKVIEAIPLQVPKIPILSTVTAGWLTDEQAQSPAYWAQHSRETVNFSGAIQMLEAELQPVYLETGPGNTTSVLAKQHGNSITTRSFSAFEYSAAPAAEQIAAIKALGKLWQLGIEIHTKPLYTTATPRILHSVPTYAYIRKKLWLEAPAAGNRVTTPPAQNIFSTHQNTEQPVIINAEFDTSTTMPRKELLIEKIKEIMESASGIDIAGAHPHNNFIELGLDSLLITQIASSLKKEFKQPITFRQLNEDYDTLDKLATYLDSALPPEAFTPPQATTPALSTATFPAYTQPSMQDGTALSLITQQLNLLAQQVALLHGNTPAHPVPAATVPVAKTIRPPAPSAVADELTAEEKAELKKPFGATARIETKTTDLTQEQKKYLETLIAQYNNKTAKSKTYTQEHRPYMADPRVVSGFRPLTKEMVYSIVVKKSAGSYLWDIDDNKYIDALNGFGSNYLGYQHEVLKKALIEQAEKGYEIGPQHELAGEVCKMICEFTQMERAGLCNTGSEAVLGAMRIARTVSNKNLIVAFSGSYHGIVDEVLVRGTKKLKTFPAASGILSDNVQNMLILDYGTNESLEIIKQRADEIAAVLVEPVQSRRPEFQPVAFLKQLRTITAETDVALIFDEVITGFRSHPGGTQALFGIKADLATYGKVVGGGISLGVIAGSKKYMDALDGGFWQFGDASIPEVGVTYFAGTFVRHPLVLATSLATLKFLKEKGPALQQQTNLATEALVKRLSHICKKYNTPLYIAHFSSLWKIKFHTEYPYHELLFTLMRLKNIHIWDGFPCFVTVAHTQEDLDTIARVFEESVAELCHIGLIPTDTGIPGPPTAPKVMDASQPPVPGAKLGKDRNGNATWFIEDLNNPGKYLQID